MPPSITTLGPSRCDGSTQYLHSAKAMASDSASETVATNIVGASAQANQLEMEISNIMVPGQEISESLSSQAVKPPE